MSKAWAGFWLQKQTLLNPHVDPLIRIKALDVWIKPTLLYGSGAWTPTKADLEKLLQTHKAMIYKIISVRRLTDEAWLDYLSRRHRRARAILFANQIFTWDICALKSIHSWAGHIARYEKYDALRFSYITTRWRDSQYISFVKARSYDGKRLYRGHRRRPWRWEQAFYDFYNCSHAGDYPSWRKLACQESLWSHSCSKWTQWRLARASNLTH